MPDADESAETARANPDLTRLRHAFTALPVTKIVEETFDAKTFVFEVPDELVERFIYSAGQFCTIRAMIGDEQISRCYSMSSAPAVDKFFALTVKRVPGGRMSNWLHDNVSVGDRLDLMPPAGTFCERAGSRPVLAFCGGSGVTPVFSLLKHLLASGERRVRVLDANRDRSGIIFADSLDDIAEQFVDRVTVRHHLDSDSGYLTPDDVAAFVGEDTDVDVFVCGPSAFMDIVEGGLAAAGVAPERVAIERFVEAGALLGDVAAHDDPVETPTEQLTIRFKRKRHRIDYFAGDSILDAARRAGISPPFSCLAGECATCMALVLDGTVAMRTNHILTDAEVREGWVLTCQGFPTSPQVSIEYESL